VVWASWPFYFWGGYQARHFQATFVLPTELHDVVGFTLFGPYYTGAGDFIPIDDNIYLFLNGTYIGAKGTDYGASNAPLSVPGLDIHETNGWHQDGTFGVAPLGLLYPGTNVLDIVAEDRLGGGGTGPLNVLLLDQVPEPATWLMVALSAGALLGSRRVRHRVP
jgi:hypothetical protein